MSDTVSGTRFSREEEQFIVSQFAEGLTSKEVAEAFFAKFGRRVGVRDMIQFRRENKKRIEGEVEDEVEVASNYLSPAGLLRHAYRMVRKLKEDDYRGRISDIATLLRFVLEVWDRHHHTEEEREKQRREIEEELKEVLAFFEHNKELIDTATRNGLLRFAYLQVGDDVEKAQ